MKKNIVCAFTASLLFTIGSAAAFADQVDCATADQDIQRLEHEKLNTAERVEKGVTSIMPVGLVVHTVKGTEKEDLNMSMGDYNERIDKSMKAIKDTCNMN